MNKTTGKTEYLQLKTKKAGMSQLFADDATVVPFTELVVRKGEKTELLDKIEDLSRIKLSGYTKGKGFAGVIKRWGFSGGPKTHGQSDSHRAPGSIGTQGQGRVIPGRKMPGRMGGEKITFITKVVQVNKDKGSIYVKGGIPGSRNSEVTVFIPADKNES